MNQTVQKMTCDLERHFGELAKTLPDNEKESFTCTAETFSELPGQLQTDCLVIRKAYLNYEGAKVDRLQFFARRSTYRELGLLALSVVFHPRGSRVHVVLGNPSSDIKNLIIEYRGSTPRVSGHQTIPWKFSFSSERIETHPWTRQNPTDLFSLPRFTVTNLKEFVVTEDQWASRDTVIGFGNDDASVRLAALLLNIGSPANETTEIVLEGEGGFRGVGVRSAEAAFYLPGSLAWPDGVELRSLFPVGPE
jgi:hypothetical protein